MSCGATSCPDQQGIDFGYADSGGSSVGFLQVVQIHEEFTRTELHKLLDKARALAQYGIFDDTKRDLLVDLAETLDLLDALVARDELDILEMEEAIRDDPQYVPHIRVEPVPPLPSCGHGCPFHSRIRT